MIYEIKAALQSVLRKFGYQIRKLEAGADLFDAYVEQKRLVSGRAVKTIFEVGAADGRDTETYAGDFPSARVFGFEPVPDSFARLSARSANCPRIRPINAAVSREPGSATFHIGTWADSSSLFVAQSTGSNFDQYQKPVKAIKVDVVTLDDIAEENDVDYIDILKMDAQGAELDILMGASRLLEEGRIGLIYCEVHFMESYKDAPLFDRIMSHLLAHGFYLHNLYDLSHNHEARLAWGDAIFVHKSLNQPDA